MVYYFVGEEINVNIRPVRRAISGSLSKVPDLKDNVDRLKHVKEEYKIYGLRISGKLRKKSREFRLIDTFSGAGGMSLGFSERFGHLFKSVWANDFNEDCVKTYNANFGNHCVSGDIVDLLKDPKIKIPRADVVIGGPPCQGFSLLNKKRDGDPRKQLWRPFLEIVERSKAEVFVMENVPQLLGSHEYNSIVEAANGLGFTVRSAVLCAADYGVPQTRRRAVIIGSKKADPAIAFPPLKTNFDGSRKNVQLSLSKAGPNGYLPSADKWRTVRDAIFDLPAPIGVQIRDELPPLNLQFGRTPTQISMARYRAIPKEGMNRVDLLKRAPDITPQCWIRKKSGGTDLFGRLWWDRPSFTIRTEFYKPEKGRYLHPQQHRPITHREAARLQSFPDDFVFVGTKIEIAKQIGNAVPPLLAARIADAVYMLLNKKR